jgi:hypothetical protein
MLSMRGEPGRPDSPDERAEATQALLSRCNRLRCAMNRDASGYLQRHES